MKAAIYQEFQKPLSVQDVPDPNCPDNGVIIEVKANGICRSDWHAWMGHDSSIILPHVPGHELSGVIAEVGKDVKNWQVGQRVTTPFCGGCGSCRECLAGQQQICDDNYQPGFSDWGSFAQFVKIPFADLNIVELPQEIDFVEAASLGCRFMTAFSGVVDKAKLRAGETIAVHGCGGVGLSAIMIASALGADVIAVDINPQQLELAKSLGATHCINATDTDVIKAIKDLSDGGAHVSIDALGSSITSANSVCSLRKRGRHVQIGLMHADDKWAKMPMAQVIAKELQIMGSHGMQAWRYPDMLAMIASGKLEPNKLIGKTVSLEEAAIELTKMGDFGQQGVTVIDRFV